MALAGRTLNPIVVVMPAIIGVVTAAQATHLLSRFQGLASSGDGSDRAMRARWWEEARAVCWRPCLLSAATTAAGFASLAVSDIPPVRDLGLFTGIGVLPSFVLTFTLVAAVLVQSGRFRPRPIASRRWNRTRAAAMASALDRHAAPVLGLSIALVIVTLVIAVVFRSASVLVVSLVPNLLPVALVLGGMGLAGVALDTATITVSGIAFGLIVDDTIHFVHGTWLARQGGRSPADAIADTLFTVGRPVLVTSVAVAAGFGLFALSPFRPTHHFGLLIAAASLAAMICDLVVLPALLQLRRRAARADRASEPVRRAGVGGRGSVAAERQGGAER